MDEFAVSWACCAPIPIWSQTQFVCANSISLLLLVNRISFQSFHGTHIKNSFWSIPPQIGSFATNAKFLRATAKFYQIPNVIRLLNLMSAIFFFRKINLSCLPCLLIIIRLCKITSSFCKSCDEVQMCWSNLC